MQGRPYKQTYLYRGRQSYTNQLSVPDELQYFKFGRERDRIKSYVQAQLDSEQIRKKQQALLKFQQQAQMRRHHYLPKFITQTQKDRQKAINPSHHYTQSTQMLNPQVEIPHNLIAYNQRFSSYVPNEVIIDSQYQTPPLVATEKTKPPAYNYYNVLPHRSFDQYGQPSQLYHSKTLQLSKAKSHMISDKDLLKVFPQHSRAMSLEVVPKQNHRAWALKKIKQAAIRKKQQNSKQRQVTQCSSGLSLVGQLQKGRKKKMAECEQLSTKLNKLKKYRRYIAQQQKHNKLY